jgi:hypothetical protein
MVVWDGTSTIQYYHQSVQMSDFSQNNWGPIRVRGGCMHIAFSAYCRSYLVLCCSTKQKSIKLMVRSPLFVGFCQLDRLVQTNCFFMLESSWCPFKIKNKSKRLYSLSVQIVWACFQPLLARRLLKINDCYTSCLSLLCLMKKL